MLSDDPANYAAYLSKEFIKHLLNVGGFKLYGDGALGSPGPVPFMTTWQTRAGKVFTEQPAAFQEVAAKPIDKISNVHACIGDSGK